MVRDNEKNIPLPQTLVQEPTHDLVHLLVDREGRPPERNVRPQKGNVSVRLDRVVLRMERVDVPHQHMTNPVRTPEKVEENPPIPILHRLFQHAAAPTDGEFQISQKGVVGKGQVLDGMSLASPAQGFITPNLVRQ